MNPTYSIRRQILLPVVGAILFMVIAFFAVMNYLETSKHDREMARGLKTVQEMLSSQITADENLMTLLGERIINDASMKQALADGDKAALYQLAFPFFQSMKWGYGVSHLYFHTPDLINLLRVHDIKKSGDSVKRETLIRAAERKRMFAGFELGSRGSLTFRVVMPVYQKERLVGFVELGRDINAIVTQLTRTLPYDLAVFVHKEDLDRTLFSEGVLAENADDKWNELGIMLGITDRDSLTNPRVLDSPELHAMLQTHGHENSQRQRTEVAIGDKYVQFSAVPLNNISGEVIGEMVVFDDFSHARRQQLQTYGWLGGAIMTLSVILVAVFWHLLGRVERTVTRQRHEVESAHLEREATLIENERRVSNILNSISDIFMTVDREWHLVFANKRAEEIFNTADDAFKDQSIWDVLPELSSYFYLPLKNAMASEEAMSVTAFFPPLERWYDLRAFPTVDGLAIYMLDITEQYQAEENLRKLNAELENRVLERTSEVHEREARLHAVLNTAADGIITIDKVGTVQSYNPAAEDIFGFTAGEVIGNNIKMLMPEHIASHHDGYLSKYAETKEAHVIGYGRTVTGQRKNGVTFPLDLAVSETLLEGKVLYTGIVRDVTARVESETQLKLAKEQAETANQAKSEFLSAMSHDLRTPLNAILGFTQLLETDPVEPLSEEQIASTGQIIKAGNHLLALINEILELAKIESGNIKLSIEAVDIKQLLNQSADLIRPMAAKRDIAVSFEFDDTSPDSILGDLTRTRQVLINILSNAVKYNREGGSITIILKSSPEGRGLIGITDTGPGIAPDAIDGLFEPFNRLDAEDTEIEGTGIGLTITKELVERMDGTIRVDSMVGEGSTFWVEMPLVDQNDAAVSSQHVATDDDTDAAALFQGGEGVDVITILYIEDNAANLSLMEEAMSRHRGIKLLMASSGREGISLARTHQPDGIVLDINMAGMDGFDVLGILKNHDKTKDIPVLALSANALEQDVRKGLKAGFVDYLTKPVDIPKLLQSLANFTDPKHG